MTENARLTIDLPKDKHKFLKTAAAQMGISMKELLLMSVFEKLQEVEDAWLAREAEKVLADINSGKEKLISFETMKKRLKL